MPEVSVTIGGRSFDVACQDGEQTYVETAAALLDEEATALVEQMGRVPEGRMLLMAGLMLADRTVGLMDRVAELEKENEALKTAAATQPVPEARRVEVPVVPSTVLDSLAELAARAESLADEMESERS